MFTLIDLPYAKDALEPVISAKTLEFHHGKHLQAPISPAALSHCFAFRCLTSAADSR